MITTTKPNIRPLPVQPGLIRVGKQDSPGAVYHVLVAAVVGGYYEHLTLCGQVLSTPHKGVAEASSQVDCPACQERRNLGLTEPPVTEVLDPVTAMAESVTTDTDNGQPLADDAQPTEESIPRGISEPPIQAADGRFFAVYGGISNHPGFAVYQVASNGSVHRVKSPLCRMRDTRDKAQADLKAWLNKLEQRATPTRSDESAPAAESTPIPVTHGQHTLPVDAIDPSPLNPRKRFNASEIHELSHSIQTHGILEPLVVRVVGERWQIICGERRYRAAIHAGLSEVPVVVREVADDREALELMITENLQRKDIDPIEEASGYAQLVALGHKQVDIAERVNRSQPAVANAIRLLQLPESVQQMISEGVISTSHGLQLLRYAPWPRACEKAAEVVVERRISSHDLEGDNHGAYWMRNALIDADVARTVHLRVDVDFDAKICTKCPHQAFLKTNDDSGLCMNPKHHKELREAAANERRAHLAAIKALPPDAPKPTEPIHLKNLKDGEHISFEYKLPKEIPPGCRPECPHRVPANARYSDRLTEACLNPSCWRSLQAGGNRDKRKARKERAEGLMLKWGQAQGEYQRTLRDRGARLIAGIVIANCKADSKRAAVAANNLDIDPKKLTGSDPVAIGKALDAANMSQERMLAFAAECRMRDELEMYVKEGYRRPLSTYVLMDKTPEDQELEDSPGQEEGGNDADQT